jgi:hypothetical protein
MNQQIPSWKPRLASIAQVLDKFHARNWCTYGLGESPNFSVSSDPEVRVFRSKPTARVTDNMQRSKADLIIFMTWIYREIFTINSRQTMCYPQILSSASREGHKSNYEC